MSLAKAATPIPMATGDRRQEGAQLGSSRNSYNPPLRTAERTDLDSWTARALDAGARLRHASMAFNRAICCQHPESIGAAFEAIGAAKAEIDEIIGEALEDNASPAAEAFATACREYRGNAVGIAPPSTPRQRANKNPSADIRKPSETTARERERLRRAHPVAWAAGERSSLRNEAIPPEFSSWSAEERSAFFAAAYLVGLCKLRDKK